MDAKVQLEEMDAMRATTVLLSATTWNVELVVLEEKAACVIGPPGRLELLGSPYCSDGDLVVGYTMHDKALTS